MLRESIVGHYLKYCVFVNEHPSSGTGNQFPVGLNSQGRWELLYPFEWVCLHLQRHSLHKEGHLLWFPQSQRDCSYFV